MSSPTCAAAAGRPIKLPGIIGRACLRAPARQSAGGDTHRQAGEVGEYTALPMIDLRPACDHICSQTRFWAYLQLLNSKAERIRKIAAFTELETIART